VKLRKDIDFIGRTAMEDQKKNGVKKMMACFTCPPEVILQGRETIYRNGERVGWLTSGGFGYTVDRSIGYGYVRNAGGVGAEYIMSGEYELEVATERVKCAVSMVPLYDPAMERVKI
jgi:4-methylaminobutanoate oxidase (formaldehyde-forming)